MRARFAVALLAASVASAAFARAPELPRELRGRVALDVRRCRPVGRSDALLEATVRVRAHETAVALPGLHCGAYDDEGNPLFLTPVTGQLRIRARESQEFSVRFAADAKHRECGCTVRDLRGLEASGETATFSDDEAFERLVGNPSGNAADTLQSTAPPDAAQAPRSSASPASADEAAPATTAPLEVELEPAPPFAPPALRFERVLAPNVALRSAPAANAASTGAVAPGARIAVDRIERGWKLARTPDGLTGWLPGDASSADVSAPERMAERLEPLHTALEPGASTSEALCAAVRRSALSDLVAAWRLEERAVYVNALWFALAHEDRAVFQIYASECFNVKRVMDATSGREIRSEASGAQS